MRSFSFFLRDSLDFIGNPGGMDGLRPVGRKGDPCFLARVTFLCVDIRSFPCIVSALEGDCFQDLCFQRKEAKAQEKGP